MIFTNSLHLHSNAPGIRMTSHIIRHLSYFKRNNYFIWQFGVHCIRRSVHPKLTPLILIIPKFPKKNSNSFLMCSKLSIRKPPPNTTPNWPDSRWWCDVKFASLPQCISFSTPGITAIIVVGTSQILLTDPMVIMPSVVGRIRPARCVTRTSVRYGFETHTEHKLFWSHT